MQVGDKVRVKYPFSATFDGVYTIASYEFGVYFLEGVDGALDETYLEAV